MQVILWKWHSRLMAVKSSLSRGQELHSSTYENLNSVGHGLHVPRCGRRLAHLEMYVAVQRFVRKVESL